MFKLKKMGFGKEALKWIKSFMSQRKQYVHMRKSNKKYNSISRMIYGGIAQGSMIGPLLFILFINDLAIFLKVKVKSLLKSFFDLLLFADDILIILSNIILENLEIDTFTVMSYFSQWCKINLFNVNTSKSKFLLFNVNNELIKDFQVLLDDEQMERVAAAKYLGILLDDTLKFNDHVDIMCKKLHGAIFVLRVLSRFCDMNLLMVVYHSLFLSHILYCINAWSTCNNKKIEKLFITQKKAIRTMLKLKPTESCKEHFKKLQILTVPALIIYSSLKLYNNKKLQESRVVHNHNTRNRTESLIIKINKTAARGHNFFSKLPSNIRKKIKDEPRSHNALVRHYLIEECPYSINDFLKGTG